jgi:hypothetical protein
MGRHLRNGRRVVAVRGLDTPGSPAIVLAVALVAIAWAAAIAFGGPAISEYGHMFDAWEMKSPSVEEAREASGLVIVAVWMIVLFIRARRAAARA